LSNDFWDAYRRKRYPIDIVGFVWYGRIMSEQPEKPFFDALQIGIVNHAVTMAEELVSNHFKMSASQWLRPKYDVKTLVDLSRNEIVDGPFAQIIRYQGYRKGSSLGSDSYDFYKVCLQDHTILTTLEKRPGLSLMPFCLYIITHELIHIIRFSKFLQNFDANPEEKISEEHRVHTLTHQILTGVNVSGINDVLNFYRQWRKPIEELLGS
jgi:hypothetical protein